MGEAALIVFERVDEQTNNERYLQSNGIRGLCILFGIIREFHC